MNEGAHRRPPGLSRFLDAGGAADSAAPGCAWIGTNPLSDWLLEFQGFPAEQENSNKYSQLSRRTTQDSIYITFRHDIGVRKEEHRPVAMRRLAVEAGRKTTRAYRPAPSKGYTKSMRGQRGQPKKCQERRDGVPDPGDRQPWTRTLTFLTAANPTGARTPLARARGGPPSQHSPREHSPSSICGTREPSLGRPSTH